MEIVTDKSEHSLNHIIELIIFVLEITPMFFRKPIYFFANNSNIHLY